MVSHIAIAIEVVRKYSPIQNSQRTILYIGLSPIARLPSSDDSRIILHAVPTDNTVAVTTRLFVYHGSAICLSEQKYLATWIERMARQMAVRGRDRSYDEHNN